MFNSSWYSNLVQPPFAPPNWLFAPAWTILYITILVALILYILKKTNKSKVSGYALFASQIFFNIIWSPIFFAAKSIAGAFIIIIILDILVLLTIRKFYIVSKISGLTLIPYFCWIIFATYLNLGYLILN